MLSISKNYLQIISKYLPVEINPCYKKSEIKQNSMLK